MVFGWAQIVIDLQPLFVMLTGEGHLHGFSHTYVGATLIAAFSALTGKYLSQLALAALLEKAWRGITISWKVSIFSAFVGTYSHVVLDSIMHADLEPFFPFTKSNDLLGVIPVVSLHELCIYSGFIGAVLYFAVNYLSSRNKAFHRAR